MSVDILTAGRSGARVRERSIGSDHLLIAWLGRRYDWLDLNGAQTALEDVELTFPSDFRRGGGIPQGRQRIPDVFHLVGSQLADVLEVRSAAPESAIVLDLSHSPAKPRWSKRTLERQQRAAADLVVVGSVLELREARRQYPQLAERIARLERPLDLERHAPPVTLLGRGDDFREFRRATALDGRVLLYAGPYAGHGGLDAAIAAAASLAERGLDLLLVAIREGELDGRYLQRCVRQARALGVRMLIEDAPRAEELPFWYAAASVVCLPSRDGAGGEPARLAAAAARPIIGSEVESLLERVIDGETGILVPVDDHRALVEAIAGVLVNEREGRRVGNLARRQIETEASPSTAGAQLRRLWEMAIRRRRGAGGAASRRP